MASKKTTDAARILIEEFKNRWLEFFESEYKGVNVTRHRPKMEIMVEELGTAKVSSLIKDYFRYGGGIKSLDHFFDTYHFLDQIVETEKQDRAVVDKLLTQTQIRIEEAKKRAHEQGT